MASDTFVCGMCQAVFHDIHFFVQHKSEATCDVRTSLCITTEQSQPSTSLLRLTTDETDCANPTYFIIQDGALFDDAAVLLQAQDGGFGSGAVQTAVVLNESEVEKESSAFRNVPTISRGEGKYPMNASREKGENVTNRSREEGKNIMIVSREDDKM